MDFLQRFFENFNFQKKKTHIKAITAMDDQIGRIVQKLKDIGEWENTLIVFRC